MTGSGEDVQERATAESPLLRIVRRRAGAMLGVGVLLVCSVVAVALREQTSIVAAIRGPRTVDAATLVQQIKRGTAQGDLVRLRSPVSVDSGLSWEDRGKVTARFRLVFLDDSVLFAVAPLGVSELQAGEIRPIRGEVAAAAQRVLQERNERGTLLPVELITTGDPRLSKALRTAATLAVLLAALAFVAYALRAFLDPLRSFSRFGASAEERRAWLRRMRPGPPGHSSVQQGAIVTAGPLTVRAAPLADAVWCCVGRTRPRRFGLRLGKQMPHLFVHTLDHRRLEFPFRSPDEASNTLLAVHADVPWAFFGEHAGLSHLWASKRADLFAEFDRRRELVLAAQPERTTQSFERGSEPSPMAAGVIDASAAPTRSRPKPTRTRLHRWLRSRTVVAGSGTFALLVGALPTYSLVAPTPRTAFVAWDRQVLPFVRFVEDRRGKPFKSAVPVLFLDADEFDRVAANGASVSSPTCEKLTACLDDRGEPVDLRRTMFEMLGMRASKPPVGGNRPTAVGFYSPIEKRLFVRGRSLTPDVRTVLVHELTHAWQDQYFDLHAAESAIAETDALIAFRALVEGDATRIENAYFRSLPEREQTAANEHLSAPTSAAVGYDQMLLVQSVFPYTAGLRYAEILAKRGQSALDAGFVRPPVSEMAVLVEEHVAPASISIRTSPEEKVLYEETLDLLSYFATLVDQQSVDLDAFLHSWAGAKAQLIATGGRRCVRLAVAANAKAPPILPSSIARAEDKPAPEVSVTGTGGTGGTGGGTEGRALVVSSCASTPTVAERPPANALLAWVEEWSIGGALVPKDGFEIPQALCVARKLAHRTTDPADVTASGTLAHDDTLRNLLFANVCGKIDPRLLGFKSLEDATASLQPPVPVEDFFADGAPVDPFEPEDAAGYTPSF